MAKARSILLWIVILIIVMALGWWIYRNIINDKSTEDYKTLESENSCLALNYHRIRSGNLYERMLKTMSNSNELQKYSVFQEDFDAQLKWMTEHGATFVSEKELQHSYETQQFPKGCVWLSFDDGDKTMVTNALPVLEKYNVPATVFVIAGQVGNPSFNNIELATWGELRALQESDLISFGSHTYDMHELVDNTPIFNQVPAEQFKADLMKSKKTLKKELGIDVKTFAYPYGNATDDTIKVVKDAGFDYSYILAPAAVTKDNYEYLMNRVMVDDDTFEHQVKHWKGFRQ